MFAHAYDIAASFTFPVLISSVTDRGKCQTGIGTFVVVNPDGWIVTAGHVVQQITELNRLARLYREDDEQRKAILSDTGLSREARKAALRKLPGPGPQPIKAASVLWAGGKHDGPDGQVVVEPAVDVAFLRLRNFDPTSVSRYPEFKDPAKGLRHGTSLLRVGYPFHSITPTYDEESNAFNLPAGALPVPRFPIEGIMTRTLLGGQSAGGYPLNMIETSSPGLMGQSGGPILDREGAIWAIQAQTRNLALGFAPKAGGGREEHQFLNVGVGASVETILGAFVQHGVQHVLAKH